MGNEFQTLPVMSKTMLAYLKNNLVASSLCDKGYVSDFKGKSKGSIVDVKLPILFTSNSGNTGVLQDIKERIVQIEVNGRENVMFEITQEDMTLNEDRFNELINKSAAIPIANKIEASIFNEYLGIPSAVGTAATTPTTVETMATLFGSASQRLDEQGAMDDGKRVALIPSSLRYSAASVMSNIHAVPDVATSALKRAYMKEMQGLQLYSSQLVKKHTAGVPGGTPLSNGLTAQEGATINVDGLTATTGNYKKGDIITFAGIYAVNPITKDTQTSLRQFTVTADTTANGSGQVALPIYPAVISTGAYKNVSGAITDGLAVVLLATHTAGIAMYPGAIAFGMLPLDPPKGAGQTSTTTFDNYSLQVTMDYDITSHKTLCRVDAMWFVKLVYPELAVRLIN